MRSPALESAEKRRDEDNERLEETPRTAQTRKKAAFKENSRYVASESTIGRSTQPRKALPRKRGNVLESTVLAATQTIGWRSTNRLRRPTTTQTQPAPVISEAEQARLASLEMSLPRVAGKIDSWLMIIVLALLCVGVVMVDSASSFLAASYTGDASYYFQRELLWAGLGVVAMLVTMRIDYRYWRRLAGRDDYYPATAGHCIEIRYHCLWSFALAGHRFVL
jgi:cell division protein FtsW